MALKSGVSHAITKPICPNQEIEYFLKKILNKLESFEIEVDWMGMRIILKVDKSLRRE